MYISLIIPFLVTDIPLIIGSVLWCLTLLSKFYNSIPLYYSIKIINIADQTNLITNRVFKLLQQNAPVGSTGLNVKMAVTEIPINVMSANVKMDGEEHIVPSLPEPVQVGIHPGSHTNILDVLNLQYIIRFNMTSSSSCQVCFIMLMISQNKSTFR